MKNILLIFALAFAANLLNAQNVDLKKGIVYVDSKECLKYEGKEVPGFTFSNMAGEELFFIGYARDKAGNTIWRLSFLKDKKVQMTYRLNFPSKKACITRMVKDGLISNCTLNPDKIDNFVLKYDEKLA